MTLSSWRKQHKNYQIHNCVEKIKYSSKMKLSISGNHVFSTALTCVTEISYENSLFCSEDEFADDGDSDEDVQVVTNLRGMKTVKRCVGWDEILTSSKLIATACGSACSGKAVVWTYESADLQLPSGVVERRHVCVK